VALVARSDVMLSAVQQHAPDQIRCRHPFSALEHAELMDAFRVLVRVFPVSSDAGVVAVRNEVNCVACEQCFNPRLLQLVFRSSNDFVHELASGERGQALRKRHHRLAPLVLDDFIIGHQPNDQLVSQGASLPERVAAQSQANKNGTEHQETRVKDAMLASEHLSHQFPAARSWVWVYGSNRRRSQQR
jgi:hypothetical protein